MRTRRLLCLFWLCLFWLCLPLATPARAQDTATVQSAVPLVQSQQAGSSHITLTANRTSLGLADRFQLTLAIEAPTGTEVTLPEAAEQLGTFTVQGQTPTGPTIINPQTQRWQQVYTLEASATGEQTIPPLTFALREPNAAPDAEPTQIQTEPLSITVNSVLPEDADIMAPQDIAPPVGLTAPGLPSWAWLAAAAGLCIALAGGLFWWRHRRRQRTLPPPPPRPAHELALEALQHLQRDKLMDQQAIEPFYVRLSSILRQYIEWRFELRAPEQTTEEFLALASGGFIATHRDLLSTFLHQCDLVKFARHQPDQSDMQNAFDSAKAFIEQTADDEVLITVPQVKVAAS